MGILEPCTRGHGTEVNIGPLPSNVLISTGLNAWELHSSYIISPQSHCTPAGENTKYTHKSGLVSSEYLWTRPKGHTAVTPKATWAAIVVAKASASNSRQTLATQADWGNKQLGPRYNQCYKPSFHVGGAQHSKEV